MVSRGGRFLRKIRTVVWLEERRFSNFAKSEILKFCKIFVSVSCYQNQAKLKCDVWWILIFINWLIPKHSTFVDHIQSHIKSICILSYNVRYSISRRFSFFTFFFYFQHLSPSLTIKWKWKSMYDQCFYAWDDFPWKCW